MGKKAWIAFGIICAVIVMAVLLLILILVPQIENEGTAADTYQSIARQDYTYSGRTKEKIEKDYVVTESDVNRGKKTKKYVEGNINPFTPPSQVTIYNEPTLNGGSSISSGGSSSSGSGYLTPADK